MRMSDIVVVHSVSSWLPQTETWLYNQIRFLPSEIDNHIICEETKNLEQFYLPKIHSFSEAPRWRYYWDKSLRKLKVRHHLGFLVEQARKYEAQVLHSHFGNIGWSNIKASVNAGLKNIVTFYGLDVNMLPTLDQRWYCRYRYLFNLVDRILCEGPHMAKSIIEMGCPKEKIIIHHLGITVNEIPFKPRIWTGNGPLKVLIAATFREKKGIPYALEALGLLRHEVPLEITIIGDATNEERSQDERRNIFAIIDKYKLRPNIRLLGFQPHNVLFEEAYKHHIFLSPSITATDGDTEGGAPVTIIEMVATGMPVVSTRHCDIPEVIIHGKTGWLAEERDVNGLLENLSYLIEHPRDWGNMLKAGRCHIETSYDVLEQGKKLGNIYKDLIEEGS